MLSDLSDLDLGKPGGLRSDLRSKIALLYIAMVEHLLNETLEATEAVKDIKVTEATEAEVLLKV